MNVRIGGSLQEYRGEKGSQVSLVWYFDFHVGLRNTPLIVASQIFMLEAALPLWAVRRSFSHRWH
jgi:hypothetical protein